jgi:hypothetical protein
MNKEQLGEFLKKQAEQLYGRILDEARVSDMGDRQFKQFSSDVKQYVRESMEGVGAVVGEFIEK